MSLIMDAIKRAQQLRAKESKGSSYFQEYISQYEKRRPKRKKGWIFAGAGSGIILLVLILFWGKPFFPLLASHQNQKVSLVEKKRYPVHQQREEDFQEPSKEGVPSTQTKESVSSTESVIDEERAGPPIRQLAEEKKGVKAQPRKKVVSEKGLPPTEKSFLKPLQKTPASPKEEGLSQPIGEEPPIHTGIRKDFQEPLQKADPPHEREKSVSLMDPSAEKKQQEPITEELTEQKTIVKVKPPKKIVSEKKLPSPGRALDSPLEKTAPSPQGEGHSNAIGVEQESGKDGTVASDVLASFNLGVYFHNRREILKAIQAYQKVVELEPTYFEAYNNLGIIYQEIGDFDRAFEAYQKAVEINPRYEKAYNNLGTLLYRKGGYEESMEAFQKALAINSTNIESHINLGILFKKQGQLGKAIESYQKALAIDPLNGETHYNIALLYEQLENVELAIAHYRKFIQLSSETRPGLIAKVKRHLDYLVVMRKNGRQ